MNVATNCKNKQQWTITFYSLNKNSYSPEQEVLLYIPKEIFKIIRVQGAHNKAEKEILSKQKGLNQDI